MAKSHFVAFILLALLILGQIQAAGTQQQADGQDPKERTDPTAKKDGSKTPPRGATARPNPLPKWIRELDLDNDGQVSLDEWRAAKRSIAEFNEYDLNNDGFITPQELLRHSNARPDLILDKDRLAHTGAIEGTGETYRNKTAFKVLRVRLEAGKTYQFDLISPVFQALIFLEDADGNPLAESGAANVGDNCRLTYRATFSGTHRVVVTSVGGFRVGAFNLAVRAQDRPSPLPQWFRDLDEDGDGQVSLNEWRMAKRPIAEFNEYDLNGDGFITPQELARRATEKTELVFDKGKATHVGVLAERPEPHRGKTAFTVVTARLEAGKTYRFDLACPTTRPFFFLEDASGTPLAEHGSQNPGDSCRIRYRSAHTGTYRVVVTSTNGGRIGPFTLSARIEDRPSSLPQWFRDLDEDGDGQVSLGEWRMAKRPITEFNEYDLNGDGFITSQEFLRVWKQTPDLVLVERRLTHAGVVAEADEMYRGKTAFKVLTVRLEAGKTYQFDLSSVAFQSLLFLEDADGEPLDESGGRGVGDNCRLVHRAVHAGIYRVIATSVGGVRVGPFKLAVRDGKPSTLPPWFDTLDTDGDGQVSLDEWRAAGRVIAGFREYDLNDDGLITPRELTRRPVVRAELVLDKGKATHAGAIDESIESYRGKTAFNVVTVRLEAGKTYQFDLISPAFQAFTFLEDASGNPLAENSSPFIGGNSRIVYRATRTGTYRIIVTSLGGFRIGAFTLTTRDIPPPGMPLWFVEFDRDGDGQISLDEWRAGGRAIAEFNEYDLNGDGLMTLREVTQRAAARPDLKFEKGRLTHAATIAAAGETYRGKTAFKVLTVRLEAGTKYHFGLKSPAFQSFLFLEDANGKPLAESSSSGIGADCKLAYRPAQTGIYRVVVTSLVGFRVGPFTLTARDGAVPPSPLPAWFQELDTDGNGQVGLDEWRAAGRTLDGFRAFDLNDDGFITPQELLRSLSKSAPRLGAPFRATARGGDPPGLSVVHWGSLCAVRRQGTLVVVASHEGSRWTSVPLCS